MAHKIHDLSILLAGENLKCMRTVETKTFSFIFSISYTNEALYALFVTHYL